MTASTTTALHRILVIDDEQATLFGVKRLLSDPDTNVDTAATLDEAKELLDHHTYQLVLADLRLSMTGAMEGFEVIKHAKSVQPFVRVIVFTAYGTEEDKKKVLDMGAEMFMEKPVSPSAIRSILRSLSA